MHKVSNQALFMVLIVIFRIKSEDKSIISKQKWKNRNFNKNHWLRLMNLLEIAFSKSLIKISLLRQSLLVHLQLHLSQSLILTLSIYQPTASTETSIESFSVEQSSLNVWNLRTVWKLPGLKISYWKKLEGTTSNSNNLRNSIMKFNQHKLWMYHSRSLHLSVQETTLWDWSSDMKRKILILVMKSVSKWLLNSITFIIWKKFKLTKLLKNLSNRQTSMKLKLL